MTPPKAAGKTPAKAPASPRATRVAAPAKPPTKRAAKAPAQATAARRSRPKPPPPSRGDVFAAKVRDDYELSDDEDQLLTEAARCLDSLEVLHDVVIRDGTITKGSMGQLVVHPAVSEARQMRTVVLRLLGSLGLALADDEEGRPIPTPAQLRGRAGARARWGKDARRRGGS